MVLRKCKLAICTALVFIAITTYTFVNIFLDNTIKIHIGYQSVTSQTWGALIIKNQGIFERKLKELYPNKKIEVVWHDEVSGAVINTGMISGKVHFGFMGNMPLLLNMHKAETLNSYNAVLLGFDGKGIGGENQSIVVAKGSNIKTISDLRGKTISVPVGSSAHFMLLKVLEKYGLLDQVNIAHQDVAMASQLLANKMTDAFAIWAPYPNYLVASDYAEILIDGAESEIDYLAGVIANKNWVNKNQDIVNIFVESLSEAHEFINDDPEKAATIFSAESGFPKEIAMQEVTNITWDSQITSENIETMKQKMDFLIDLGQISEFDFNKYVYTQQEGGES